MTIFNQDRQVYPQKDITWLELNENKVSSLIDWIVTYLVQGHVIIEDKMQLDC